MSYYSNCKVCGVHISSVSPISVHLCPKHLNEKLEKLRNAEEVIVDETGEIRVKGKKGVRLKPHTWEGNEREISEHDV